VTGHLFGVYLRNPAGGPPLFTIVRAATAPEAVEAAQASQATTARPADLFPLIGLERLTPRADPYSRPAVPHLRGL
jgi:hypothetical protein